MAEAAIRELEDTGYLTMGPCQFCGGEGATLTDGVCDRCRGSAIPSLPEFIAAEESRVTDWSAYVSEIRARMGLPRRDFAALVGVKDPKTVRRWELGVPSRDGSKGEPNTPHPPYRRRLAALCFALDTGELAPRMASVSQRILAAFAKADTVFNDNDAKDPLWLRGLKQLLLLEDWEAAEVMAEHLHEIAQQEESAEFRCLFYVRWGIAARRRGKPRKQVWLCRKALDIAAREPISSVRVCQIHNAMGCALTRLKQYAEAIEEYHSALAIDSDYWPSLYNRLAVASLVRDRESCEVWHQRLEASASSREAGFDLAEAIGRDPDMQWWKAAKESQNASA